MAEILVIGGGIAGISAGAELARDASVVVLEGEPQIGYHSTGRSAAVFILNYGNATLRALNRLALPALEGGLLGETVLSPRGELLVAEESALAALEDYLAGSSGLERLTAAEACAMVPALRQERIAAAAYERQALDIDVDRLLQGYARLLRARGGRIETGQRVQAIAHRGGVWRVETSQGVFEAPILVNAGGAWADAVAGLAGVARVGLQPMRRSAVMMALPSELDSTGWPLFASAAEDWYAKPEGARLMISPADEDPVDPQDAWPDDMVLAEGLDRFSQMVDVPLVRPSHSWAGLRSFVPDRTPVAGFAPGAEGFFWLAGQGGYGVQTSPALAAVTRVLVTGGGDAPEPALLAALSPERFAA